MKIRNFVLAVYILDLYKNITIPPIPKIVTNLLGVSLNFATYIAKYGSDQERNWVYNKHRTFEVGEILKSDHKSYIRAKVIEYGTDEQREWILTHFVDDIISCRLMGIVGNDDLRHKLIDIFSTIVDFDIDVLENVCIFGNKDHRMRIRELNHPILNSYIEKYSMVDN